MVQRLRNINATIFDHDTPIPTITSICTILENNRNGNTLNLGETVILQKEINPFLSALRRREELSLQLHNHWLFDEPRLMSLGKCWEPL